MQVGLDDLKVKTTPKFWANSVMCHFTHEQKHKLYFKSLLNLVIKRNKTSKSNLCMMKRNKQITSDKQMMKI